MAEEWGNLIFRGISIATHSLLGANAAARADHHPLTGIPSAVVLESLSHSKLAESMAGGAAVAAGYVPLALGNLDFEPLIKWIRRQLYLIKWKLESHEPSGYTFEEYMGTPEEQREERGYPGMSGGAYTPPPAKTMAQQTGLASPTGADVRSMRLLERP